MAVARFGRAERGERHLRADALPTGWLAIHAGLIGGSDEAT